MRTDILVEGLLLAASPALAAVGTRRPNAHSERALYERELGRRTPPIAPKIMIISMFYPEADVWYDNLPGTGYGDLLSQNISVPGLSPIYPEAHCTASGEICQMTAGESEINAATSMASLLVSHRFDFSSTYFLINGIAGVSPKLSTLGSVALSKFTVQVAMQYEFDARDMPENFTTGYLGYGADEPDQYPTTQYGTEVMEVNEELRDLAFDFASKANLTDSEESAKYRAKYRTGNDQVYAAASTSPTVVKCDSATSDVYFSGNKLAEAFENTTKIWTNQTDLTYCMTAQEDTAILQALMRADLAGLADYSRAMLLRTGSDFDRPPPNVTAYDHLRVLDQNGYDIAVANIFMAGIEIVKGIVDTWNCTFAAGIKPKNYIGDILGSLGGEPNFGPGTVFTGDSGARADGSTYTGYVKKRRSMVFGKRSHRNEVR